MRAYLQPLLATTGRALIYRDSVWQNACLSTTVACCEQDADYLSVDCFFYSIMRSNLSPSPTARDEMRTILVLAEVIRFSMKEERNGLLGPETSKRKGKMD